MLSRISPQDKLSKTQPITNLKDSHSNSKTNLNNSAFGENRLPSGNKTLIPKIPPRSGQRQREDDGPLMSSKKIDSTKHQSLNPNSEDNSMIVSKKGIATPSRGASGSARRNIVAQQ